MTTSLNPTCSLCPGELLFLDIPRSPNIAQCSDCHHLFEVKEDGEISMVTDIIEKLTQGDDRIQVALSGEHEVKDESVMELITTWRACTEMETLAMIGRVQQRLALLDNRLHSIKKRLAESLLGEPRPIDSREMLELVDECIDLASPAPARERGVRRTKQPPLHPLP
jgi:hypothetical protein